MSAPPTSMVRCPRCRLTTVDRGYCPLDGARMAPYAPLPGERLARCPMCERILDADVSHCPEDGCRLEPLAEIDDTAAPAPTPAPGTGPVEAEVFDGRYRLLARIGAGGMGTVYRARQLNMDRDVAVKLIRADAAGDRERADRFRQEARIIARLQHPNVLTVIDFGCTAQGVLYLVTELLHGAALSERLEAGPLTPAATVELLREVCSALVEAHGLGIVHRDLKPANLFLHQTRHSRVTKVLDFGVAKLVEEPGLTASGQLIGSPAYMSPEQCSGRRLDAQRPLQPGRGGLRVPRRAPALRGAHIRVPGRDAAERGARGAAHARGGARRACPARRAGRGDAREAPG